MGREELWDKSTAWMKEEGLLQGSHPQSGRVEADAWREQLRTDPGKGAGMMPHLQEDLHVIKHAHIP